MDERASSIFSFANRVNNLLAYNTEINFVNGNAKTRIIVEILYKKNTHCIIMQKIDFRELGIL